MDDRRDLNGQASLGKCSCRWWGLLLGHEQEGCGHILERSL